MMGDEFGARILSAIAQANDVFRHSALTTLGKSIRKAGTDWAEAGLHEANARIDALLSDDNFAANALKVAQRHADEYFAEQLSRKIGIDVSSVSEEAIARALGAREGVVLRSLHDLAIIEEDLVTAAAERIFARMGWALDRAIRTRGELLDELQRRAAQEIEARVHGLVLRRLETLEDDVAAWVAKKIHAKTGCSISDIRNLEQTKKEVIDFSFNAVRRRLGIRGTGGGLKMTKRALQLRQAQRRFYQKHGNRHKYTGVK